MQDETRGLPHQVSPRASLWCPVCSDAMSVVTAHRRAGAFVARHFRHQTNETSVGESDAHLRIKLIAFSKLANIYPHAEVALEASVGNRRTDVLVTFSEARFPHGRGLAVEVQHQNNSKDLFETDQNYYKKGFSMLWLSAQHYSGKDVSIDHIQSVWSHYLPRLWSYDGLSWPVESVESQPAVERMIPFPPELLTVHEADLQLAFECGQKQRAALAGDDPGRPVVTHHSAETSTESSSTTDSSDSSWGTHQNVWLSKPHHPTNRSTRISIDGHERTVSHVASTGTEIGCDDTNRSNRRGQRDGQRR